MGGPGSQNNHGSKKNVIVRWIMRQVLTVGAGYEETFAARASKGGIEDKNYDSGATWKAFSLMSQPAQL